jgi:hypothetical protein
MPARSAPPPLSDDELAVIRELHADCCDPDCDVPNLFAAIDAIAAERDALRVALLVIRDFRRLDGGDSVDQLRAVARAALEGAAGGERG